MKPYAPRFVTHDDPYLKRRRRRGVILVAVAVASLAGAVFGIRALMLSLAERRALGQGRPDRAETLALWDAGEYASVAELAQKALAETPLDPFFLSMHGLSSFYLAMSELDAERKAEELSRSVFSLRKAVLDGDSDLEAKCRYILGKAYYHQGLDYAPEAISQLSAAADLGFTQVDTWEYLGLASKSLGDMQASAAYFEKAMAASPDSYELKAAAAAIYVEIGRSDEAEKLAREAMDKTQDAYLRERCAFLLADIYRGRARFDDALALYQSIKDGNPESADAWYYEGLVYQALGDQLKARAAWRKAVSIDPMHQEARKKLAERT